MSQLFLMSRLQYSGIEVQNLRAIQRKERLRYSFLHELYYFSKFKATTAIRNDKVKNSTQEKTGKAYYLDSRKLEMDPEHEWVAVIYRIRRKQSTKETKKKDKA